MKRVFEILLISVLVLTGCSDSSIHITIDDFPDVYEVEDSNNVLYKVLQNGSKKLIAVKIGDVEIREKIKIDPNELAKRKKAMKKQAAEINLPKQNGLDFFSVSPYRFKTRYEYLNPLADLNKKQISELQSVIIEEWQGDLPEKFGFINPKNTFIQVIEEQEHDIFKMLPKKIRYLYVEDCFDTNMIESFERFSELRDIRIFMTGSEFDLSLITQNNNLKRLHLSFDHTKVENLEKISTFRKLKNLSIPYYKDMADISFVSNLKKLEKLNIAESNATDLGCLENLNALEYLDVSGSPVEKLPVSLPKLKTFYAMGNKLSQKQISEFKKNNPDCVIIFNWNDSVPDLLVETTRMEFYPSLGFESEPFMTITDTDKIAEFITNLEFDPQERDVSTLCTGDFYIKFYDDERHITDFEIVCEDHIRWEYGKPIEISLTLKSGDFLAEWLADNGINFILEKREETKEKNRKAYEKFENHFYELLEILPEDLSEKLRRNYQANQNFRNQNKKELSPDIASMINHGQIYKNIGEIIFSHYKDKEEFAKVSLTALSELSRNNTFLSIFKKGLNEIDPIILQKVFSQFLENDTAVEGICLWFFRSIGYENLSNDFLEEYLEQIVMSTLEYSPERDDRLSIINRLGRIDTNSSRKILREILNGRIFDKLSPTVDSHEKIMYAVMPVYYKISYRAWAARSLAELDDLDSLPLIQKLHNQADPNDARIYEMALKEFDSPD